MRWIIVSNRLPFSKLANGELQPSSGGLVTALSGVHSDSPLIWLGIAPEGMTPQDWEAQPEQIKRDYQPIFVEDSLYQDYYNGLANDVFWPLFHYEGGRIKFEPKSWQAFQAVNQQIAEAIAALSLPGDHIWVHDFHLFLVPEYLRKLDIQARIGFFLHIPFPSSELFRQLPVREEILQGLLGADLIGFHDYSYLRHFCQALLGVLELDSNMLSLRWQGRLIRLGVFPVSIDVQHFMQTAASPNTWSHLEHFSQDKNYKKLILGVDRLDYTKGLILKLQMFKALLESHPELQGQVSLLQLAIPTRQEVKEYRRLRAEFERMVGEINGRYSQPNYTPVQYIYSSISFEELLALYQLADVMLVTSRRDGMNLVALEYIVSQDLSNPGMVVLSEFTGAASMLSSVLTINPWDACGSAQKIYTALEMPLAERRQRVALMQEFLKGYTASDWARSFIEELSEELPQQPEGRCPQAIRLKEPAFMESFFNQIQERLLLFLDYDGTLVPIQAEPALATLSAEIRSLVEALSRLPKLDLVVISGRDSEFLAQQFEGLELFMAAEHGAKLYDPRRREWLPLIWTAISSWYPSAERIMQDYSKRVPGSFVERKQYALAWHYRKSPAEFASYQARKLKEELEIGLSNLPVSILSGSKVIEARAVEANKGNFIRNYLESYLSEYPQTTIMALGDDVTDEEMIQALDTNSLTIKVGDSQSCARYRLAQQSEVLTLLKQLIQRLSSPKQASLA